MESWFNKIYDNCEWGDNGSTKYRGSSGGGSCIEMNEIYIQKIRELIQKYNIQSIVDLGCGDWQSSYLIYKNLENVVYTGYDCYKALIETNKELYAESHPHCEFVHLDIYKDREQIKDAELYILKDILQHWTCEEINTFLDWINSKPFRCVIVCNCKGQVYDYQNEPFRSRPLSVNYYPLKNYPLIKWFEYGTKEVSGWTKDETFTE
jgi:SAM-dependent methyltransferase